MVYNATGSFKINLDSDHPNGKINFPEATNPVIYNFIRDIALAVNEYYKENLEDKNFKYNYPCFIEPGSVDHKTGDIRENGNASVRVNLKNNSFLLSRIYKEEDKKIITSTDEMDFSLFKSRTMAVNSYSKSEINLWKHLAKELYGVNLSITTTKNKKTVLEIPQSLTKEFVFKNNDVITTENYNDILKDRCAVSLNLKLKPVFVNFAKGDISINFVTDSVVTSKKVDYSETATETDNKLFDLTGNNKTIVIDDEFDNSGESGDQDLSDL